MAAKEYKCKICYRPTLYGFNYCAYCELKRRETRDISKQFNHPKFGSKKMKETDEV